MLITNIKGLVGLHPKDKLVLRGSQMSNLPVLENAWLLIEGNLIKDFGKMSEMPSPVSQLSPQLSAKDKYVFPSWCDSHTHIVFAASREEEFALKIQGKSYEEIAAAGGATRLLDGRVSKLTSKLIAYLISDFVKAQA
ncbi:MAG: hypothetical protein EOO95_04820 [Pedobacter sp.]|nr:MAG: hypothetical protein EOO95_04820 [Pedobacter sp.]